MLVEVVHVERIFQVRGALRGYCGGGEPQVHCRVPLGLGDKIVAQVILRAPRVALGVGFAWVRDADVECGDFTRLPHAVGIAQLYPVAYPVVVAVLFAQCRCPRKASCLEVLTFSSLGIPPPVLHFSSFPGRTGILTKTP